MLLLSLAVCACGLCQNSDEHNLRRSEIAAFMKLFEYRAELEPKKQFFTITNGKSTFEMFLGTMGGLWHSVSIPVEE
jgi:hypothetical protein